MVTTGQISKKELDAYRANKLVNVDTFQTAIKVCTLLFAECDTHKQVERTLIAVKGIMAMATEFPLEGYLQEPDTPLSHSAQKQ